MSRWLVGTMVPRAYLLDLIHNSITRRWRTCNGHVSNLLLLLNRELLGTFCYGEVDQCHGLIHLTVSKCIYPQASAYNILIRG
ncbi:hypothetical protein VTK73DRAFT_7770 [Phialemonium thermophilum]|uniref:Uncharacterized protein n=1 Tax=Phialemonium thermophilum TaxID=223376 RepID=A0ABR3XSU6_9PEZI